MDEPINAQRKNNRCKTVFSERNGFHKTIAERFDGAILAQYYTLGAVLLNQRVSGCNSPASSLVCQLGCFFFFYCWHVDGETVNLTTGVTHVSQEGWIMSDYVPRGSLRGMGVRRCLSEHFRGLEADARWCWRSGQVRTTCLTESTPSSLHCDNSKKNSKGLDGFCLF